MKANWKFAIVALATLAFVACNSQKVDDKTVTPGDDTTQVTPPDDGEFISKISVSDNSLADWDNVPAAFLATATRPDDAYDLGLKSVKVYADEMYINVLVEIDDEEITGRAWTPFHMYIDADGSATTGGYGDEFADAGIDIMLETAVFAENQPYNYNPGVSWWYGEVNGTGWEWCPEGAANDESDCWCAKVCSGDSPIGNSQYVDGKFEIQLLRELILSPVEWGAEFGIGFDIQQEWTSVGILPTAAAVDGARGLANALKVKIDK